MWVEEGYLKDLDRVWKAQEEDFVLKVQETKDEKAFAQPRHK